PGTRSRSAVRTHRGTHGWMRLVASILVIAGSATWAWLDFRRPGSQLPPVPSTPSGPGGPGLAVSGVAGQASVGDRRLDSGGQLSVGELLETGRDGRATVQIA